MNNQNYFNGEKPKNKVLPKQTPIPIQLKSRMIPYDYCSFAFIT
jgi:hypothetical protein